MLASGGHYNLCVAEQGRFRGEKVERKNAREEKGWSGKRKKAGEEKLKSIFRKKGSGSVEKGIA